MATLAIALAVAGAAALIGWSSLAAAIAQEENVTQRVAELAPDERAIQVVYHLVPFESRLPSAADKEEAVSVLLSQLGEVRDRSVVRSLLPRSPRVADQTLAANMIAGREGEVAAGKRKGRQPVGPP